MELTFDYSWELVSRQAGTVCLCGSGDGQIEKKEDMVKKWGESEYDMVGMCVLTRSPVVRVFATMGYQPIGQCSPPT